MSDDFLELETKRGRSSLFGIELRPLFLFFNNKVLKQKKVNTGLSP